MFSKPLILALLVSISLNCLFGYLSYSFYSDKAVAESQLDAAVDANKGLQLSLEKKETACKITDVIVSEYTKENPELAARGEANGNSVLTEDVVRQIRSFPGGLDETAEKFGIGRTTAWRVKTYRSWKHVS